MRSGVSLCKGNVEIQHRLQPPWARIWLTLSRLLQEYRFGGVSSTWRTNWSFSQNFCYYSNVSAQRKRAEISPHLYLSFCFCCCIIFSTWTQACSFSVQLDILVFKCSKILQGRKHYTNNLLSDSMFIWLCACFLHYKMRLCTPVPTLFKEVYVFSCLVLSPLCPSKCYVWLSYCRNSNLLSFHQKKVIQHTNTVKSTLVTR